MRRASLQLFARHGYEATSLQDVADAVGYTKANVLYHFGSKQGLFDAAVGPGVEDFERLIGRLRADPHLRDPDHIARVFVEFLFDHLDEVDLFINRASTLAEQPLVRRANELIDGLVELSLGAAPDSDRQLRIDIAFSGVAYCIASAHRAERESVPLDEELRERFIGAIVAIASID
nr:TetR/AcrR family transcriptional regulator [Pseudoclavibacter chungangensis]